MPSPSLRASSRSTRFDYCPGSSRHSVGLKGRSCSDRSPVANRARLKEPGEPYGPSIPKHALKSTDRRCAKISSGAADHRPLPLPLWIRTPASSRSTRPLSSRASGHWSRGRSTDFLGLVRLLRGRIVPEAWGVGGRRDHPRQCVVQRARGWFVGRLHWLLGLFLLAIGAGDLADDQTNIPWLGIAIIAASSFIIYRAIARPHK